LATAVKTARADDRTDASASPCFLLQARIGSREKLIAVTDVPLRRCASSPVSTLRRFAKRRIV
jgi:hypothetical protein